VIFSEADKSAVQPVLSRVGVVIDKGAYRGIDVSECCIALLGWRRISLGPGLDDADILGEAVGAVVAGHDKLCAWVIQRQKGINALERLGGQPMQGDDDCDLGHG
jgi:hypothetical protein